MEKSDYLSELIWEETGIEKSDVIDYELFLYEYQKGILMGPNQEFISASRIDDLSMVYAGLSALTEAEQGKGCKAHGVHPNYGDKHDPENRPVLGGGPVIKYSASQRYATTAFGAAYFMDACERAGVPFQRFVNRNDIPGGSTIGPALSGLTTIPTVDMGAPVLAMHSIREFGAVSDQVDTKMAFLAYFS